MFSIYVMGYKVMVKFHNFRTKIKRPIFYIKVRENNCHVDSCLGLSVVAQTVLILSCGVG